MRYLVMITGKEIILSVIIIVFIASCVIDAINERYHKKEKDKDEWRHR